MTVGNDNDLLIRKFLGVDATAIVIGLTNLAVPVSDITVNGMRNLNSLYINSVSVTCGRKNLLTGRNQLSRSRSICVVGVASVTMPVGNVTVGRVGGSKIAHLLAVYVTQGFANSSGAHLTGLRQGAGSISVITHMRIGVDTHHGHVSGHRIAIGILRRGFNLNVGVRAGITVKVPAGTSGGFKGDIQGAAGVIVGQLEGQNDQRTGFCVLRKIIQTDTGDLGIDNRHHITNVDLELTVVLLFDADGLSLVNIHESRGCRVGLQIGQHSGIVIQFRNQGKKAWVLINSNCQRNHIACIINRISRCVHPGGISLQGERKIAIRCSSC